MTMRISGSTLQSLDHETSVSEVRKYNLSLTYHWVVWVGRIETVAHLSALSLGVAILPVIRLFLLGE